VNQVGFEKSPEFQELLTDYFRFRHDHRALYADTAKRRHAQVALVYSIPTMMYHNYTTAVAAAPISAMSGMARALEEGHIPFDAVILRHPEIQADRVTLDQLRKYRLLILPAIECLSDSQIDLFSRYARSGGTLGLIGDCGTRDEDNRPRDGSAASGWREFGQVVEILPGRNFLPNRAKESDATRELTAAAVEDVREALGGKTIISGRLPRLLWAKPWLHFEDLLSVHFVNYDVDFEAGRAAPTAPTQIEVTLPDGFAPQRAAWLTSNSDTVDLELNVSDGRARVEIPPVHVYGVLLLGPEGLDGEQSARLAEQAFRARAEMAGGGEHVVPAAGARPDPAAAKASLVAAQEAGDAQYVARAEAAGSAADAVLAFDFGAAESSEPWLAVGVDSLYDPAAGFGWLPPPDDTDPTPEEIYYDHAQKHGGRFVTNRNAARLLFWPYKEPPPRPVQTNLGSGAPHRFRVDVKPGNYAVRVVTTNPSWTNRNFQISGMVSAGGGVRLLDAAHDKGAIVSREFTVRANQGKLDFTFGGPTGWGVAALTVTPATDPSDDARTPVRQWRVSPHHPNPEWYPITWTSTPLESRLDDPPTDTWAPLSAADSGVPVVDLGSNRQAEIGDVVYAAASVTASAAGTRVLHFGASSSAQLWLNGETLGYVPNEKGVREGEFTASVDLRAGKNTLVVKLQRFWERRWMFYAELD
ncbi:MAG: hypothetical protein HQ582_10965, partial [Planctomycetes bacterium]|nr:hypothetical protein [Planctomycetota bacterium]